MDAEEARPLLGEQAANAPRTVRKNVAVTVLVCALAALASVAYFTSGSGISGTAAWASKTLALSSTKKTSSSKPNIVFFLGDDVGFGSISAEVTPFMISLRDEGIMLENYYSQESCTPARAALLTGRSPLSMGMQYYEQGAATNGGLPVDETTLASVLQSEGYTTYMLGKWNLGNAEESQLPTARGFNYYMGFLDGYNYYWTKRNPDFPDYTDFMFADDKCYYMYDAADKEMYSTTFFQNAAVAAIEGHDFDASPMFMYVAFQAARAPFEDTGYAYGVDDSYLEDVGTPDALAHIQATVEGVVHQQYHKSVAVMDVAIAYLYFAMEKKGQLDNTYFIFASDNGGCPTAGGRNYPLRGTKGSLFEGGTRVEAMIYSDGLVPSKIVGKYSNLFHVSDWFPTILDMAGVKYSAKGKYALDGVSHYDAMFNGDKDVPRETLLYNDYYNPDEPDSDRWAGKSFAIRNDRYKLMHTYDSPMAGTWYSDTAMMAFDDDVKSFDGCAQFMAQKSGTFTYFLFDLQEDPTETTNLYDTSAAMTKVQKELYAALDECESKAAASLKSGFVATAETTWQANSNYITPFEGVGRRRLGAATTAAPANCGLFTSTFMTGKDIEAQQAAMDAEAAASTAATTTTTTTAASVMTTSAATTAATTATTTTTTAAATTTSTEAAAAAVEKMLSPFQSMSTLMESVQSGNTPEPEGNGAHLQAFGKMEKIERENDLTFQSHTHRRVKRARRHMR